MESKSNYWETCYFGLEVCCEYLPEGLERVFLGFGCNASGHLKRVITQAADANRTGPMEAYMPYILKHSFVDFMYVL